MDLVLVTRVYSQVNVTHIVFIPCVYYFLNVPLHCWEGPISKHFTSSLHLLFTKHVTNTIWFERLTGTSDLIATLSWLSGHQSDWHLHRAAAPRQPAQDLSRQHPRESLLPVWQPPGLLQEEVQVRLGRKGRSDGVMHLRKVAGMCFHSLTRSHHRKKPDVEKLSKSPNPVCVVCTKLILYANKTSQTNVCVCVRTYACVCLSTV